MFSLCPLFVARTASYRADHLVSDRLGLWLQATYQEISDALANDALMRQAINKYRIYSFCSPGPYFFQPYSLPGPYSNGPLLKHGRLLFSKQNYAQKISLKTNISRQ